MRKYVLALAIIFSPVTFAQTQTMDAELANETSGAKYNVLVNHYVSCAVLANIGSIKDTENGQIFIEKAIAVKQDRSQLSDAEIIDRIEATYLDYSGAFVGSLEKENQIYWRVCKDGLS